MVTVAGTHVRFTANVGGAFVGRQRRDCGDKDFGVFVEDGAGFHGVRRLEAPAELVAEGFSRSAGSYTPTGAKSLFSSRPQIMIPPVELLEKLLRVASRLPG